MNGAKTDERNYYAESYIALIRNEQEHSEQTCPGARSKETHYHRANVHLHKGWPKAEWQLTLHDPSYPGSGGLLERSAAIQSKGAGRCEREGASEPF